MAAKGKSFPLSDAILMRETEPGRRTKRHDLEIRSFLGGNGEKFMMV